MEYEGEVKGTNKKDLKMDQTTINNLPDVKRAEEAGGSDHTLDRKRC